MHFYTPMLCTLWQSFWSFRSWNFPLIMPSLILNLIKLTCSQISSLMDEPCRWNNSLDVCCWERDRSNPQFEKQFFFFQLGFDTNWLLHRVYYIFTVLFYSKSVNQKIIFLPLEFLFKKCLIVAKNM